MKYFLILFFFIPNIVISQTPILNWVEQIESTTGAEFKSSVLDGDGNIYYIGEFGGTVDVNPGIGVNNFTSFGATDLFLLKLDGNGNYIWSKQIGGTNFDRANSIILDNSGNIHITGYFQGISDFDPSASVFNLSSAGGEDAFITKFNNNGDLIWAKRFGSTGTQQGFTVRVDNSGNVYSVGVFYNTVDFDPNAGTFNLTNVSGGGAYVSKLDNNGNFIWAKALNSSSTVFANGGAMELSSSGEVYVTGDFTGSCDFDPNAGTLNLSTPINSFGAFVWKLSSIGSLVWVKTFQGTVSTDDIIGTRIILDNFGNVITAGRLFGTGDFDPGTGSYNLTSMSSNADFYISKLDVNGNFIWAKSIQGNSIYKIVEAISVDSDNNIYASGYFNGTVDFDPGLSNYSMTATIYADIFASKLNSSGDFLWAIQTEQTAGGNVTPHAYSILTAPDNSLFISGNYMETVDFDPSLSQYLLSSGGANKFGFAMKIIQCSQSFNTINQTVCDSYTSPSGLYIWSNSGNYLDTISNSRGCDSIITVNLTVNSSTSNDISVTECNFYTWFGNTYSVSGDYFHTLTNVKGCDSLITLHLTIHNNNSGSASIIACTSYFWAANNTNYSTNGNYTAILTNHFGCDSMATLNLTIGDVLSPIANNASLSTLTAQCLIASLTAPTATDNCAGTITGTHNVTLPITAQGTTVVTWTYDDGNGNISTQTQDVVIDDITAAVPNITSLPSISDTCSLSTLTAPTASDNCIGTISGTHNTTLPITSSTIITWTFDDGNGNISTQNQTISINSVTSFLIHVNDSTYMSSMFGCIYQWIDCNNGNQPIVGETDQTFVANENGSYAVITSYENCSDTSDCVNITSLGIDETLDNSFLVYPNPVINILTITSNSSIETINIYSIEGKLVLRSSNTFNIDVSKMENGIYLLEVKTTTGLFTKRFVKQ